MRRMRNKDLAEILGITENSVYRLRKADEMPRLSPERLEGLCEALACQPGDLLEWVGAKGHPVLSGLSNRSAYPMSLSDTLGQGVLIERSTIDQVKALSKTLLQRLNEFHVQILALSWLGYQQYGPGAVVVTDTPEGVQIAYVERERLADQGCRQAIDQTRPELSAVVLYYPNSDYTSSDYEVLRLTGSHSPPNCYRSLYDG